MRYCLHKNMLLMTSDLLTYIIHFAPWQTYLMSAKTDGILKKPTGKMQVCIINSFSCWNVCDLWYTVTVHFLSSHTNWCILSNLVKQLCGSREHHIAVIFTDPTYQLNNCHNRAGLGCRQQTDKGKHYRLNMQHKHSKTILTWKLLHAVWIVFCFFTF